MYNKLSVQKSVRCHTIIHGASLANGAIGAGLAQLPGCDTVFITSAQIAMTIALGHVFGITLTKSSAAAKLGTIASASVGRAISQAGIGWFPGVGNAINAGTALSLTEVLGWLLVEDFSRKTCK